MNSCLTNMPNVPSQNPIFLSRQQIRGWKTLGQKGNLNCDQSTQSFWGRKWSTYSKCGLEMASRFLKCPACSQSVWRIWWGMPSWPKQKEGSCLTNYVWGIPCFSSLLWEWSVLGDTVRFCSNNKEWRVCLKTAAIDVSTAPSQGGDPHSLVCNGWPSFPSL